jgi:hypothetical protein
MVYVHTNLCRIYMKSQESLKGKTKMWDVFLDDMGLDGIIELALANMDLNELVLEPITFDEDNEEPLDESSTTPTCGATELGLGIEEEEDGGQDSGNDVDYDMEEDY